MESIAGLIDHTILKPDASPAQVERLCAEAREHGFASACVNQCWVPLCRRALAGSAVKVCTVVSFPLGAGLAQAKADEAARTVEAGADELDMVMNVGLLKAGEDALVAADIAGVVKSAQGRVVKVIIEACLLTKEEKERATRLVIDAGAQFVKTSTGFSTGGARPEDVALLAGIARGRVGVKASGGIRDLATAQKMIEAGATRIGTSSGVGIVEEESSTTETQRAEKE